MATPTEQAIEKAEKAKTLEILVMLLDAERKNLELQDVIEIIRKMV